MANTNDFIGSVNEMLDIVDRAVSTGDFRNLSGQMKDAAKPFADALNGVNWNDEEFLRRNAQNAARRRRYTSASQMDGVGSRTYNGGHMSGRGNAFYGNYSAGRTAAQNRTNRGYDPAAYACSQNAQMRRQNAVNPGAENELFGPVPGSIKSNVMKWMGLAGTVFFGMLSAIMALVTTASGFDPTAIMLLIFNLAFTFGFGFLFSRGRRRLKKVQHFSNYRRLLEKNKYASVRDLARSVGQPEADTVKELDELTIEGKFKQGHFDEQKKTFIASDELYSQYLATEQNARELRRQQRAEQNKSGAIPSEVQEVLDKGENYINRIREANDNIPGEEVSNKLSEMEKIVTRIFDEVRKNPGLADKLSMFMDYYLPTTMKLLTAYEKLDAQDVQGENVRNAKREIEGSLDTVNDAFEKLLDSFFAETAMDVTTDIEVMKTMMKQDGLTEDSFSSMRRKQGWADIASDPTLKEKEDSVLGRKPAEMKADPPKTARPAKAPAEPELEAVKPVTDVDAAVQEPEPALKPDPVHMVRNDYEIEPESDPEMEDEEGGIKLVFGSDIE